MINRLCLFFVALFFLLPSAVTAQMGISVTPPRSYFISAPGEGVSNKIVVSNPSKTTALTLAVSFNDWEYDTTGTNVIKGPGELSNSCSEWISVKPQSYFTLAPGESQELEITVTPPLNSTTGNVHTSMMFITQTNSVDSYNEAGALVKVSLRSGVKIYHRFSGASAAEIEFMQFKYNREAKALNLEIENRGKIWTDGTVMTELVNQNTGEKYNLADQIIYTLPGDKRTVTVPVPVNLKPGKYIASSTFAYGEEDIIKMAELTFIHE